MWIAILFFGLSISMTVIYIFCPVPISPLMVIRLYNQAKEGKPLKLAHRWVPLDSINTTLPQAVMASEDQNFLKHNGFDVKAIQKAMQEKEERDGREVRKY